MKKGPYIIFKSQFFPITIVYKTMYLFVLALLALYKHKRKVDPEISTFIVLNIFYYILTTRSSFSIMPSNPTRKCSIF